MNQYEKQGFDFDPELIDLFDAVLQNVHDEGDLKEEFTKLKFIKKLEGTYNSKPGPLKQLIEKMGTMEREFTRTKLDMQRVTGDLNNALRTIQNMAAARTREDMVKEIEKLQEIKGRSEYYTWNQNGK
jgi:hypothetical protein